MITRWLCLLALCCGIDEARGLELYGLVGRHCQVSIGLIIQVDDQRVIQIGVDGSLVETRREEIEHVLVYNTIDNPIQRLDLNKSARDYLREVSEVAHQGVVFIGWPIRFIEETIVFFDLEGNTHLVDMEDIEAFSILETTVPLSVEVEQAQPMVFGLGRNLPECRRPKTDAELVQPTRMLSDRITIDKFLTIYREGFIKLKRLQRRTGFYARPYLFDRKTKVALVINRNDFQEEIPAGLPLYFQWPTGKTFGPQGLMVIGSKPNEHLPNLEPVFGLRFDGKYHFLSASFAGNPFAFSVGGDFMIKNRFYYGEFFELRSPDEILVLPQYNQVALTGLERGAYSLSAGYYYPLFGLQANGIFREILATEAAPMMKLQYTGGRYRANLVASAIRLGADDPEEDTIKVIFADEMSQQLTKTARSERLAEQLGSFRFNAHIWRLNLEYELDTERMIQLSEVVLTGEYHEVMADVPYQLQFATYATAIGLFQDFGENVALKGYLNLFWRRFESQADRHNETIDESKFSFTVAIEFIL
jgi:hypothetical protein